jgi:cbb3-type cytochrome oxidase subunit 3
MEIEMIDFWFLALTILFFVGAAWYVQGLTRL